MKDYPTWEKDFLKECVATPTARRVWAEIVRVGIDDGCKRLLYGYAEAAPCALQETRAAIERATDAVKKARRALGVATAEAGDRRAMLFRDRARAAILKAVETPWPFECEGEALAYPDISGLPLERMPFLFANAEDAQRRFDRKFFLAALREHTGKHGVKVGLKRLVALAGCACPARNEDENNIARFLRRRKTRQSLPHYVLAFEAFLNHSHEK